MSVFRILPSDQNNKTSVLYSIKDKPNVHISHTHVKIGSHERDEFRLLSEADKKELGIMVCSKLDMVNRNDYNGKTLGVDYINSYIQRKGYGSLFLDFAKYFSKEQGCNGYICLKADSSLNKKDAPHQFYRKNGFSSLNSNVDKIIDKFNKQNIQGTFFDFKPMLMFYPPAETKGKSILKRFKLVLKKLSIMI